jgi:hypothetical protein
MAGRGFGVLIDRNDDRLRVRIAAVFSRGETACFFKRL